MSKKGEVIVFVVFDYFTKNMSLQPWKYINELVIYHYNKKNHVIIITDDTDIDEKNNIFKVIKVGKISPRNALLESTIRDLKPSCLYWWTSLRSIVFLPLFHKLQIRINLIISGSIYKASEILPVLFRIGNKSIKQYAVELFTPLIFTKILINDTIVNKVLVLSNRNKERLIALGSNPAKITVTGIGKDNFNCERVIREKQEKLNQIIYITSATKIRGINLLLVSFKELVKLHCDLKLKILARPGSNSNTIYVKKTCKNLGIESNVIIQEGWLGKETILNELSQSKLLIMPFLIVQSEMPISVIESFSVGTPVVCADLDGLTEMVTDRGKVFEQGNSKSLTRVIDSLLKDENKLKQYGNNAISYWESMPLWGNLFNEKL